MQLVCGMPLGGLGELGGRLQIAGCAPDPYPSGDRDRPLGAILQPVAFPKCPENIRRKAVREVGGPDSPDPSTGEK